MEEILIKLFDIKNSKVTQATRKDFGNDNNLFEVHANKGHYFIKEIPGHSKRDDLDDIYSELYKCTPKKFKMVLPIQSNEQKYTFRHHEKDYMLYPYIDHIVIFESKVTIKRLLNVLDELIQCFSEINIPEHPFKTYSNWFERGTMQLRRVVGQHDFIEYFEDYYQRRFQELNFENGNTHFDLNPFNIWTDESENIYLSDFDNAQKASYAKDIFDLSSRFLIMDKNSVELEDSDLNEILSYSKKFVDNIEQRDVKNLLIRPKLGILFDPKSKLTTNEVKKTLSMMLNFLKD